LFAFTYCANKLMCVVCYSRLLHESTVAMVTSSGEHVIYFRQRQMRMVHLSENTSSYYVTAKPLLKRLYFFA